MFQCLLFCKRKVNRARFSIRHFWKVPEAPVFWFPRFSIVKPFFVLETSFFRPEHLIFARNWNKITKFTKIEKCQRPELINLALAPGVVILYFELNLKVIVLLFICINVY